MKMKKLLLAATMLFAATTLAQAEDNVQIGAYYANHSCREMLQPNKIHQSNWWIIGYWDGLNTAF
jgi:hypothetical protein